MSTADAAVLVRMWPPALDIAQAPTAANALGCGDDADDASGWSRVLPASLSARHAIQTWRALLERLCFFKHGPDTNLLHSRPFHLEIVFVRLKNSSPELKPLSTAHINRARSYLRPPASVGLNTRVQRLPASSSRPRWRPISSPTVKVKPSRWVFECSLPTPGRPRGPISFEDLLRSHRQIIHSSCNPTSVPYSSTDKRSSSYRRFNIIHLTQARSQQPYAQSILRRLSALMNPSLNLNTSVVQFNYRHTTISVPSRMIRMSDPNPTMAGAWSDELAAKLAEESCRKQSTTMELDKSQPPTPDGTGRPENFGVIVPKMIYRSSYPQHGHFETLADLELKTIITFVPEPLPFAYANFITSNGITHHHIHIRANKDADVYTEDAVVHKVLNLMLDPENYPILIHCNKGKHRTGCIAACFRRVTGWTVEDAIEEYEHYSEPKARPLDKVFIERYNTHVLKPLALERRLCWVKGFSESSVYTTNTAITASTDYDWDGLDMDAKKRLSHDRELKDAEKYWNYK